MYDNLKATPKKVQGLLQFPAMMTPKQQDVEKHLKKDTSESWIRETGEVATVFNLK